MDISESKHKEKAAPVATETASRTYNPIIGEMDFPNAVHGIIRALSDAHISIDSIDEVFKRAKKIITFATFVDSSVIAKTEPRGL